jgi:autotransporter strand-loop-strand O-heptosyltransferase
MDLKFDISFVSRLPLTGDSPKVTIIGDNSIDEEFEVFFIDFDSKEIVTIKKCRINQTVFGERQWYTNWVIQIFNSHNDLLHSEIIDLKEKTVFIKIDAYALGDNIAWMPYIEEFRKKHNCHVICSTFHNYLFEKECPQILFAVPNTQINNVYAQYYIGATTELNKKYCPVISTNVPLQFVASKSLGLEDVEIVPKISSTDFVPNYGGEYVCISEHASSSTKEWKEIGGWQIVVDFLNSVGYKVIVISKEPTTLINIINKTGDATLSDRIQDLKYCKFFMGVSSGLAWVAWALGTRVVMISDCTPKFHEFQSNVVRIGGETLDTIDYNTQILSSVKDVISKIKIMN